MASDALEKWKARKLEDATLWDAVRVLKTCEREKLSQGNMETLQLQGYLQALLQSVRRSKMPPTAAFRRMIGLDEELPEIFPLRVGKGSLDDMIERCDLDWFKHAFKEASGSHQGYGFEKVSVDISLEAKYFQFDDDAKLSHEKRNQRIVTADKKKPWEPAGLAELLAFGAQYPDQQRLRTIIATKVIADMEGVPGMASWPALLLNSPAQRYLGSVLAKGRGADNDLCWYLAVRSA